MHQLKLKASASLALRAASTRMGAGWFAMGALVLLTWLGTLAPVTAAEEGFSAVQLAELLEDPTKEERREAVYLLQKLGPAAAPAVPQLARALHDEDDQVWHGATMSLAAIGPEAVAAIPDLVEQMGGGGARYREQRRHRSAYALSCIGEAAIPSLVEALNDESLHRRWGALHGLGLLGETAYPWVEEVLALLGDAEEEVRLEAQETCVAWSDVSLSRVSLALAHTNPNVRQGAASVIRRLGERARFYRREVHQALFREEMPAVRGAMLRAAAATGTDPEFLAPLLVEALLDESSSVLQDAAFDAVTAHDTLALECVPTLALLLFDARESRGELAAALLGRLGARALAAAPSLVARLKASPSGAASDAYLQALILVGPEVVPPVLAALDDDSPEFVDAEHWAVKALGGLAPLALETLEARLSQKPQSSSVDCAILQALPRYSRRQRAVEKKVVGLLVHENGYLRARAVSALSRLVLPEKVWMRSMRRALKDAHPGVRVAALSSLERGSMAIDERVAVSMAAIEAEEIEVRLAAVDELGRLGPEAKSAVPMLLRSIEGPSASLAYRAGVVNALGAIGEHAVSAVPVLVELLSGGDVGEESDLRVASLQALASIGEPAKSSLSEIAKLIESQDTELRRAALGAYAKIERDEAKLIPVFLEALSDPSPEVRRPVIEGLGRLGERGQQAAPRLVELLDSEPDRRPALEALRAIRPRDVNLCLKMLASDSPVARLLACERLGRLRVKEAVPALRKALRDDYSFVRRRAREALERIERGRRN